MQTVANEEITRVTCLRVTQGNRSFLLTKLSAAVLTQIAYVVARRRDDEPGAVQRILEAKRIQELKKFTLSCGDYPACIILNWVSKEHRANVIDDMLEFTAADQLAQILDGQHRVEGIRAAMKESSDVASMEIPVAIYESLTDQECADIFLSINSKQRPIPRSLVADLYGVASESVVDPEALRARDLAELLDEDDDSPYRGFVKFPNDPHGKIGISLSTIVATIKPMVDPTGTFHQVGLSELQMQRACLINFFSVLKQWHGKSWDQRNNVFLTAAGFVGAMEFLKLDLIPYCNMSKDYTQENMRKAMNLEGGSLIQKEVLKGKQGRASWNHVRSVLKGMFRFPTDSNDIKF